MMSLGGFSAIRITSCMHLTPSNNLGVKSNKKSSSKRLKKTDEKKTIFRKILQFPKNISLICGFLLLIGN